MSICFFTLLLFSYQIIAQEPVLLFPSGQFSVLTQPGNAVVGKKFGVQPELKTIIKDSHELVVNVSSQCLLRGSQRFEFFHGKSAIKFLDLRIDQVAKCILTFTLTTANFSSQIQSHPFQVLSQDIHLEISPINSYYNTSNYYNLHFQITLSPTLHEIYQTSWEYSIILNDPLFHIVNYLTGKECNGSFNSNSLTIQQCTLINWGYKYQLRVIIQSRDIGWYLTNISARFDVFSFKSYNATSEHTVVLHLQGKMPINKEEKENLFRIFFNQLGVPYPHQKWSRGATFHLEPGVFGIKWIITGNVSRWKDEVCEWLDSKIETSKSLWIIQKPITVDRIEICLNPISTKSWTENIPWKTVVLGLVICALLLPVCVLFCIWPRREREIQEKYQERMLRYAAAANQKPAENDDKDDNDEIENTAPSINNSTTNLTPKRPSVKRKPDFVQLAASQLQEQHFNVEQQNSDQNHHVVNKQVINGPQRVHLLRSRPPSKPTVVTPATAQYATLDAPSPDDSIENLARDILATPNAYDTQKVLNGPVVSSLVKLHPGENESRIFVSSLTNPLNGDLRGAGTSLPEPQ